MHLAGGVNFTVTANTMVTLKHNGTYWYEVCRQQLSTIGGLGGVDTSVQFNDAGVLGGGTDLIWNKTTKILGATSFSGAGMSLTTTAITGNIFYLNCNSAGGTVNLIQGCLAGVEKFYLDHHGEGYFAGDVILANAKQLFGKTVAGVAKALIGLLADDVIYVGYSTQNINIGNTATDNNPIFIRVDGANSKQVHAIAHDAAIGHHKYLVVDE